MTRGDVIVATSPGFGKKPRPAVILQDDVYLDISTVVVALISSDPQSARVSVNVPIAPNPANGLRVDSFVTIHSLVTTRVEKIDKRIGRLSADDIRRVDYALLIFLGLLRV